MRRSDVYRFLLRMPEELRERLAGSASASGRSLNREIVHRLERSYEQEQHVVVRQGRGSHSMPQKLRRPALALGLVATIAVVLALVAGVSDVRVAAKKSVKLSSDPDRVAHIKGAAIPGRLSRESLRSRVTAEAAEEAGNRAYPSATLPFSFRQGAIDYFSRSIRRRGNDDNGHSWQLAGPSIATYPAVLNRTNADYQASGRMTAEAISPNCSPGNCRLWVAAAGGGVWRTDNALSNRPDWTFVSGSFATNAIGALLYDAPSHTLYAGTGEPNGSGDSEAGVGIYKSTDGGSSWSFVPGSAAIAKGNSIASIALGTHGELYVGTTLGVRGVSGNSGGNVLDPNAPKVGLYESTDGGQSFSLVFDDDASARGCCGWGVNHVEVDHNGDVYMAAEAEGIYRSQDGGSTWNLIFHTQDPFGRTEFALNWVGTHTRIYVGDGGSETGNITPDGASYESTTGVYRADDVNNKAAGDLTASDGSNPGYTSFTTYDRTKPGYLTYDYCWQQCGYDNEVVSPAGNPDMVYVIGAYNYDFPARNNGRAVLLSTDAGTHWYDQTADLPSGKNNPTQNGIHPDQHAIVVNPSNPLQFFEGSDGGLVRSSGSLADGTAACDARGLNPVGASYAACKNSLAQIPTAIVPMNAGLSTLQFSTVSVDPRDSKHLQGGTQDNGTWEGKAGDQSWGQTMYGDGGQSGFDVGNPKLRFNNFYSPYLDVNFQNGDPTKWVIASATFFTHDADGNAIQKENAAFYMPVINDPVTAGTIYAGLSHVWRTTDWAGDRKTLEANCPEFTTFGDTPGCGDFQPLADPTGQGMQGGPGDLTGPAYGTDKHTATNDYVVRVIRSTSNTGTLWAATRRGRVFISQNADAAPAAVTFTRIDTPAQPRRFVSGIVIDPTNPNHAYVSFGGYNATTPTTPGHVFDVLYNPLTHTAAWSSLDNGTGPLGDLPVTDLALDKNSNRLYAGTDFGVLAQAGNSGNWVPAAPGMPMVEISGLTVDTRNRVLYAATHGRAIWQLQLRDSH